MSVPSMNFVRDLPCIKSLTLLSPLINFSIASIVFPKIDPLNAFLSSLVIKLAVPSAVFKATLPVKPSETITLTCPA